MHSKPQSYTVVTEEHVQAGTPPAPAAMSGAPPAPSASSVPAAAVAMPQPTTVITPPSSPAAAPLPATGTPERAAGRAAPAAPPAPAPAPVLAPRLKTLELTFSGESWVEIYDARGMRLFFGFGHTGTTQTLNGAPPFRFVLGNVPGVALSLGGAGVSLPEANAGARVHFTLNAAGNVAGVR
jgi:cytoskeleton protein RodZ